MVRSTGFIVGPVLHGIQPSTNFLRSRPLWQRYRLRTRTFTRLDLHPPMLRKSAPVYSLRNTMAETGLVKSVVLVRPGAELAIARMSRTKGRLSKHTIR